MSRVLVLDTNKRPLMPCHPARARELLSAGKAAVWRRYPFTIILKERIGGDVQSIQIKLDPGSKTTGIALVMEGKRGKKCIWGAELQHRGIAIKMKLVARRSLRSFRRNRTLRSRPARFLNRTKPKGWLAPSLLHRVLTVDTWVRRLATWTPANAISMELVRFDMQQMENPEISGAEYQQGQLAGYEVREYLLEKWERTCAYCNAKGVPLQIEHIHPKSKGGSNRISNLCVACETCNQKKGSRDISEFLAKKPELLQKILAQAKRPFRDAAAVNSTRWKLYETLKSYGFPVEIGSGGRTKFNRRSQRYSKAHWIDAACVGESGGNVSISILRPLLIKCMGHGNRQACKTDAFGFPNKWRTRTKVFRGFQTGDMVRADVPTGKNAGRHVGRISVRATGKFALATLGGKRDGINWKYFRIIQKQDGYGYS
ncbi:RNA-guided endonuclease IscB (plasmid) [Deinococcus sp. KNUC1210]|uniref:RNA-guided endonuclease IscB n=1 Tax=Deinococcus sp. KNUC1210 TaxID=2917691 RepID=UPI001EF02CFC|nr:RNA-guided endonuclease IscB [Deinococcus sp. KNUC1210]ULH17440.1 RNA-guided endonuclease IscB [Deinococcus sp. KNUC1210]